MTSSATIKRVTLRIIEVIWERKPLLTSDRNKDIYNRLYYLKRESNACGHLWTSWHIIHCVLLHYHVNNSWFLLSWKQLHCTMVNNQQVSNTTSIAAKRFCQSQYRNSYISVTSNQVVPAAISHFPTRLHLHPFLIQVTVTIQHNTGCACYCHEHSLSQAMVQPNSRVWWFWHALFILCNMIYFGLF